MLSLPNCSFEESAASFSKQTSDSAFESEEWSIVSRNIDPEEQDRLRALRYEVRELDYHEACHKRRHSAEAQTLLRFLRARDGDVVQAAEMFEKMLDWRISFQLEEKVEKWNKEYAAMITKNAELIRTYGTTDEICRDKFGVPVTIFRLGVSDVTGMIREVGDETLLVRCLALLESIHTELRSAIFRHGTMVRGQLQIIDVGDYGQYGVPNWWTRMLGTLQYGIKLYPYLDNYYPETARKVFIIRMGVQSHELSQHCWPLIADRTREKMRLCGPYSATWVTELRQELLDGQVLPAFLTSDTDAAFAAAEPKGGIVPVCAEELMEEEMTEGVPEDVHPKEKADTPQDTEPLGVMDSERDTSAISSSANAASSSASAGFSLPANGASSLSGYADASSANASSTNATSSQVEAVSV